MAAKKKTGKSKPTTIPGTDRKLVPDVETVAPTPPEPKEGKPDPAVPPPEAPDPRVQWYVVTRGGAFMGPTSLVSLDPGHHVNNRTHNIPLLRQCGIGLEPCDAPNPPLRIGDFAPSPAQPKGTPAG